MGDGLGEVAKSWLADPPWQKVFKHTFDVIEDYVNYILVEVFLMINYSKWIFLLNCVW